MSSDDEVDYMSEDFIKESFKNDIRPGLIHNVSVKRSFENSKKKNKLEEQKRFKNNKPVAVLETQNRDEGLEKPIASDNKGFAMMQKMGFNPGSGLGAKGQGIAEPIKIELKKDKEGLGRKEVVRELMEKKKQEWKEKQKNIPSVTDYRAGLIAKQNEKNAEIDLGKSQKACFTLDSEEGYDEPEESWFWPARCLEKEEESEDEKEEQEETEEEETYEPSTQDKLEIITEYLRSSYFYCIWCGVKYENAEDMKNCPGPTKDDH